MPDDKTYGFNREDTIELINLIGHSDFEFPEISAISSGLGAMIAWTPVGGIPAATLATDSLTLGSASCVTTTRASSVVTPTTTNVTVYNTVTQAISGSRPIQCKMTNDGIWVVDVEICGAVGDGDGGPNPNPPLAATWDEDDDLSLGI